MKLTEDDVAHSITAALPMYASLVAPKELRKICRLSLEGKDVAIAPPPKGADLSFVSLIPLIQSVGAYLMIVDEMFKWAKDAKDFLQLVSDVRKKAKQKYDKLSDKDLDALISQAQEMAKSIPSAS